MLIWEKVESKRYTVYRVKVTGGWLVAVETMAGTNVTFYPDLQHLWDGPSLP